MTVIAMSIEPGALSECFASQLAASLGLEHVDQRHFEQQVAEHSDASDGGLPRLIDWWSPFSSRCKITADQLSRRMTEEVLETAARGNVLIVGWAAPVILRRIPGVLRVSIRASMAERERNIMQQLAYNDARIARWEIESRDALLFRFIRRMFDADWRNSDIFDVIMNAEHMPADACAEFVMCLAQSPRYKTASGTEGAIAARLSALHKHELALSIAAPRAGASVFIGPDKVSLAGTDSGEEAIAKVERHLRGPKGGTESPKWTWKPGY